MDPNAGKFVSDEEAAEWMTRFDVGETVKVKGEEFEIEAIEERRLVLRPRGAEDRAADALRGFFPQDVSRSVMNRHDRRRSAAMDRHRR